MKRFKIKLNPFLLKTLPVLILFLIFTGLKFDGGDDDIYVKINKNMDIFGRVYKEIALNYVDEVDADKFMKAGIEGMLGTLDPYTNFIDVSRRDEVDLITTGKYGGVGITIGLKDSAVVITDVMEGYSAEREGLRRGDKIIEIDGTAITIQRLNDIRSLVRGPAGSSFKMKVMRSDKEIEVILTRQDIQLKNVTYKGVLEGGIGYIKLERFNKYAENEIIDALTEFKAKGEVKGIILDLRDNPGGLLDAAVAILNKFVDRGSLLLTTKGRKTDSEKKYFSYEDPVIGNDVPLAVLVNQNTASASEIVAGAIQDLDRGVVVGTKSFGKGLVQIYTPLSYDDQLKITTQKYFTPSGRWIQAKNYFKENKFGVFKEDPYYNKTDFKTLNGRNVLPEGGITPDSTVTGIENNELLQELLIHDAYYIFAAKYVSDNPNGNSFAMNENVLDAFYNYINNNQQQVEISTTAETELSQLKKLIEEKNYSDKAKTYIGELESELRNERLKDFEKSKPEIKRQLEIEILKKYNKPEKEVADIALKDDIQLQTALGIIKDRLLYNSMLNIR
jgi:carboxyl-terminal processing protease